MNTLADLQRAVAAAERIARDDEATRAAAAARSSRLTSEESERRAAVASALASYFGATSAEFLADALEAYAPASAILRPIYEQLRRVVQEPTVDVGAVVEALHCLASSLPFGAPRSGDKLIGAAAAKAVRSIPRPTPIDLPARPQRGVGWYHDWAASAGVALPSRAVVDFETESQWRVRIESNRRRGFYSASGAENDQLAAREAELLAKRRAELEEAADVEHHAALEAPRMQIVAVLDATIEPLPFDPAYWWAREFRRVIANEKPRVHPHPSAPGVPFTAWRMSQVLGVRFDFSGIKP